VAGYERELDERERALQNGQVAVADAAGVNPDQDLARAGRRPLSLLDCHLAVLLLYYYSLHYAMTSCVGQQTGLIFTRWPGFEAETVGLVGARGT
jgi:hypothetical protein